eukprot:CAMPEP_0173465958 /NCGR_PEP_ID=MMETSP1357-20121228/72463_1 /TAXON_ID=77926 /ORGANISM="Hemiselmis rufescens, Strain PCC563" /LENGTH=136 /DNA_ID=CAMNT_0014433969 /DNA_START=230 /DNA_END=637 /DNA_ORIENTATION=+
MFGGLHDNNSIFSQPSGVLSRNASDEVPRLSYSDLEQNQQDAMGNYMMQQDDGGIYSAQHPAHHHGHSDPSLYPGVSRNSLDGGNSSGFFVPATGVAGDTSASSNKRPRHASFDASSSVPSTSSYPRLDPKVEEPA